MSMASNSCTSYSGLVERIVHAVEPLESTLAVIDISSEKLMFCTRLIVKL